MIKAPTRPRRPLPCWSLLLLVLHLCCHTCVSASFFSGAAGGVGGGAAAAGAGSGGPPLPPNWVLYYDHEGRAYVRTDRHAFGVWGSAWFALISIPRTEGRRNRNYNVPLSRLSTIKLASFNHSLDIPAPPTQLCYSTTINSTAGGNGNIPPRTKPLPLLQPPSFPTPLSQVPTEEEGGRATPATAAAAARVVDGTRLRTSMGRCITWIRIRG